MNAETADSAGTTEEIMDLYLVLGLTQTADQDDIKRGYRAMALKYHPDKAGSSAKAAKTFQSIQHAYEILSDLKLKKIYDKYGHQGLEMMQQMGTYAPFIDPDAILAINRIFFTSTLIIALLIIFPSLLSARIDKGYATYTSVFTPLFIIDALAFIFVLITSIGSTDKAEAQGKAWREKGRRFALKALLLSYLSLFTAFQILLCLQLDSLISIDLWLVFTPYLILEGFNFIYIIVVTFMESNQIVYTQNGTDSATSRRKSLVAIGSIILSNSSFFILRIVQIVLIILKISELDCDWYIIFVPTWTMGLFEIIYLANQYSSAKRSSKPEEHQLATFKIISFIIWGTLFFIFIGLLISRLNNPNGPRVSIILIPIYIVLALAFLCCCCCLPCGVGLARQSFEEELAAGNLGVPVDSSRRIHPATDFTN